MRRAALILMIITIISKLLGFLRDITLSYFYGASSISDAYIISQIIPNVLFVAIATGIATGYIPMFTRLSLDHGKQIGIYFTNNLINITLVISAIVVVFSLVFTEWIVYVLASGFEGEALSLAVKFTRISIFCVFFTGLIRIFNGFLQVKERYIIPALIGLPANIAIIVSIYLSSKNIIILAFGSVIAVAFQVMVLLPFVFKNGLRYQFVFNLKNEHIKKMTYIALPIILGVSVNQLNVIVDKTLASRIISGGISALNYANVINVTVQGIFVLSLITVMYPVISKLAANSNIKRLKQILSEVIGAVNLIVVPATIGIMILAEPIVQVMFGRGAFDEEAIYLTSNALIFYSIGILGISHREVLSRVFFSLEDTKTPVINAATAVLLNIILNLILSKYMGINGLALATSISALFCTILLYISLKKKIGFLGLKKQIMTLSKIMFASIIMGLFVRFTHQLLLIKFNIYLSLVVIIFVGLLVYSTTIFFMRIKEVDAIVALIRNRTSQSV